MDHVVVSTHDPERAAALYGARLGLDMALDRSHPDWGRLMFFRCGDLIVEVTHRPGKQADAGRDRPQDRLRGMDDQVEGEGGVADAKENAGARYFKLKMNGDPQHVHRGCRASH